MENIIYSNLGNKINKTFKDKRENDLFTVKDFIENKWTIHQPEELKLTFIKDLKLLLKKENLFELIESFFELEHNMQLAEEKLALDSSLINLDEFYRNLSPVLLRGLMDQSNQSNNSEIILNSIKESMRISLEEQIYSIEE